MIKRNRIALILAAFFAVLPFAAAAEPISFEQAANVTGQGGLEAGADFNYSYTTLENQGIATTFNQSYLSMPVYVRVGLSLLEAQLTVPFVNVRNNYNSLNQDQTFTGLDNINLMVKSNFFQTPAFNLAVGLTTFFPTSDVSLQLSRGLDFTPFAAADLSLGIIRLHGNLGYQYSGQYTVTEDPLTHESVSNTEINPGDAIYGAVGVELPLGDIISVNAELSGTRYGSAQINGSELLNSGGNTLSFIPGIRLMALPFKAKLGLELPLEGRAERPQIQARGDWKVIGGVSLQFSMGGPNPDSASDNKAEENQ